MLPCTLSCIMTLRRAHPALALSAAGACQQYRFTARPDTDSALPQAANGIIAQPCLPAPLPGSCWLHHSSPGQSTEAGIVGYKRPKHPTTLLLLLYFENRKPLEPKNPEKTSLTWSGYRGRGAAAVVCRAGQGFWVFSRQALLSAGQGRQAAWAGNNHSFPWFTMLGHKALKP
jgi:hypothetical protein